MYMCLYNHIYIYIYTQYTVLLVLYILEDSCLFGPSPWKILRHYL